MGSEKSNICSDLLGKYEPEQGLKVRKQISTSENGVIYTASVNPERETAVFQVDGCIVTEGDKCDKLILSASGEEGRWSGHFVELKGRNIRHAVEQLEATLKRREFKDRTLVKRFARVVGRSFPSNSGNPFLEDARNRFKVKYNCELKSLKSSQPDKI